jgi:hypothetical protein
VTEIKIVNTIENKTYQQNETVNLDEHVFVNCVFNGTTVIYSGTTPFNAINCQFRGDVRWTFAGPAGRIKSDPNDKQRCAPESSTAQIRHQAGENLGRDG